MTLHHLLHQSALKYRQNPALGWKVNSVYKTINYQQLDTLILKFSAGLLSMGVQKGERVAILSENRPEWVIADLALNKIGAVDVPIHTNFSFKYIRYILANAQITYLIISDFCYNKIKEFQDQQRLKRDFNGLKKFIYIGVGPSPREEFIHFKKILVLGEKSQKRKIEDVKINNQNPEKEQDIASIVYTSGTTGLPKGVILSNKNFLSNISGLLEIIPVYPHDKFLSFLPLSHVLERTCGYYSALASGAIIYYAENPRTLPENLQEVKPSVLISVPRIYEKFYEKIFEKVRSSNQLKQKLFYWAMKVRKVEGMKSIQRYLAEELVFKKIKNNLGGGLRLAISGGASLNVKIAKFFEHLGLKIIEGYGLTETSPVLTCNRPDNYKLGTVGLPLAGVEIKIDQAKEILARGPNIAQGYLIQKNNNQTAYRRRLGNKKRADFFLLQTNNGYSANLGEENSLSGFTSDGWFKTGDLGFIDKDGFLTIIGRKKIMLITSGGKNVNPESLESSLCLSPFINQAMVVGDRQKFISALIVPDQVAIKDYVLKNNIFYLNYKDLLKRGEVISLLGQEIQINLKNFADYEQVKKFILLTEEFTQENNELTPTLKLKRAVILKKYEREIEMMYKESD